jgi:hypothetical protein
MRRALLALSILTTFAGCGGTTRSRGVGGGKDGGGPGSMDIPNCDPSKSGPDSDQDNDGYTPNQGDCDDCNPSINPGAIQLPGDPTDYACNGMPGVVPSCDTGNAGKNDATSLAQAFEQCDSRFFISATLVGPSDSKGRAVVSGFGVVNPQQGVNMALLSTGIATDESGADFFPPQAGTSFGCNNEFANPLPNVPANPLCNAALMGMSCEPPKVNDYTELLLKLKAPTNVNSFTFSFHFFSAEYPDYVCTQFNDEFLVLQESNGEFATPTNISFDSNKNPITINNGLFTVCQNGGQPYDMNCKQPVSTISGTGYELPLSMGQAPLDPPYALGENCPDDYNSSCGMLTTGGDMSGDGTTPIGGSTGWLTTTAPVTPGEDVTLHFIIFDEGDHILDSAVLIDNFQWGTSVVTAPMTGPIM